MGEETKNILHKVILSVVVLIIFFQIPFDFPKRLNATSAWGPVTDLSTSSIWYENLVANGSIVHAAFGDGTLYYSRSLDEGTSWQPWVNLGPGTLYLEDPMAADGSMVSIVTVDATDTITDFIGPRQVGDIFIRFSRDNGSTWEPRRQLTTGAKALRVSLSISGPTIHLNWMDYRTGQWEIRYLRSTDGGLTWEPEVILAPGINSVGAGRPSIEANGSIVHAAWMDGRDNLPPCLIEGDRVLPFCTEIYYRRSIDSGLTWEPARRLTNDAPYSGRPDIALKGSTVIINYDHRVSGSSNDMALLYSNDNGTTWVQSLLVTEPGEQTHGRSISGPDGFHFTWMDSRSGSYQLYYRSSIDGLTWGAEELVPSSTDAGPAGMGLTPRFLHVSWAAGSPLKYTRRSITETPYVTPYTTPYPTPAPAPAGPIGWWKLDEGSGTTASDSSGNGRTGTLINGPLWVAGILNNAVSFDGSNDYVAVSDIPRPTDLTLSAWIYPTATTNTSDYMILDKNNIEYDLRLTQGTGELLGIAGGVSIKYTGFDFTSATNRNKWYHVVYTFNDAANTHKLYVNGVVVASGTNSASITDTSNAFWIGRHSQWNFGSFLGKIDDARIYDRTLSDTEVGILYTDSTSYPTPYATPYVTPYDTPYATPYVTPYVTPYATPYPTPAPVGPIGWWKLDETTGTSASDSSGNGQTGTLINGPLWVLGKLGNAVNFDGYNDYIATSDISRPIDLSISAWIYPTATTNTSDFMILDKNNSEYDFRLLAGTGGASNLLGVAGGASLLYTGFDFASATNRNQWHHVVYTFNDATDTHKLYINGVLVAIGTNTNSISDTSTPLWIGRHSQWNFGSFLGSIDDVRIYNRTLSDTEVADIYSGL